MKIEIDFNIFLESDIPNQSIFNSALME